MEEQIIYLTCEGSVSMIAAISLIIMVGDSRYVNMVVIRVMPSDHKPITVVPIIDPHSMATPREPSTAYLKEELTGQIMACFSTEHGNWSMDLVGSMIQHQS